MIPFAMASRGLLCAWIWAATQTVSHTETATENWPSLAERVVYESWQEVQDAVLDFAAGAGLDWREPLGARHNRVLRVTAYCDRGVTASGRRVGVGQCAAPAHIPFGTKVHIPALGRTFTVTDRTAKRFRHNTVDIYMPNRRDCLRFGRRYLQCEFTLPNQYTAETQLKTPPCVR